jgi:hypothetical protein
VADRGGRERVADRGGGNERPTGRGDFGRFFFPQDARAPGRSHRGRFRRWNLSLVGGKTPRRKKPEARGGGVSTDSRRWRVRCVCERVDLGEGGTHPRRDLFSVEAKKNSPPPPREHEGGETKNRPHDRGVSLRKKNARDSGEGTGVFSGEDEEGQRHPAR